MIYPVLEAARWPCIVGLPFLELHNDLLCRDISRRTGSKELVNGLAFESHHSSDSSLIPLVLQPGTEAANTVVDAALSRQAREMVSNGSRYCWTGLALITRHEVDHGCQRDFGACNDGFGNQGMLLDRMQTNAARVARLRTVRERKEMGSANAASSQYGYLLAGSTRDKSCWLANAAPMCRRASYRRQGNPRTRSQTTSCAAHTRIQRDGLRGPHIGTRSNDNDSH